MRFIYNTTFHVEKVIEEAFKKSIHDFYMPYVKAKGVCSDMFFTRVLVEEEEGMTFSLQLVFPHADDYAVFMELYKEKLLRTLIELFGRNILHFSTTLEEI